MAARGSLQMHLAAVLVLACLVLMPVTCGSTKNKREVTRRLCGAQLTQALSLLCYGEYNHMFRQSGPATTGLNGEPNMDFDDEVYRSQVPLPLLRLTIPHSRARRRVRREIVDECCHRGCTLAVLQSYCTGTEYI